MIFLVLKKSKIQLVEGTAEIFGCEMAPGALSKIYEYNFQKTSG